MSEISDLINKINNEIPDYEGAPDFPKEAYFEGKQVAIDFFRALTDRDGNFIGENNEEYTKGIRDVMNIYLNDVDNLN